jgi:hypothetical protein
MSRPDYEAVTERLLDASDALLQAGSHSHAIARRYYLVYHVACRVASMTGLLVKHRYSAAGALSSDYRHEELADIVESLYSTNRNAGSAVSYVGSTPGVAGGMLSDREAWKAAESLRTKRIAADYLGGSKEPLSRQQAVALFSTADMLVTDLRGLPT